MSLQHISTTVICTRKYQKAQRELSEEEALGCLFACSGDRFSEAALLGLNWKKKRKKKLDWKKIVRLEIRVMDMKDQFLMNTNLLFRTLIEVPQKYIFRVWSNHCYVTKSRWHVEQKGLEMVKTQ